MSQMFIDQNQTSVTAKLSALLVIIIYRRNNKMWFLKTVG